MSNQISAKETIKRLRGASIRQKATEQMIIRQKIAEQKAIEKRELKLACRVCEDAVVGIMKYSKNMTNYMDALREMYRTGTYKTIMKDGLTYTRDDIVARIEMSKCSIQKSWDRYNLCCKEGRLPKDEKFKC